MPLKNRGYLVVPLRQGAVEVRDSGNRRGRTSSLGPFLLGRKSRKWSRE